MKRILAFCLCVLFCCSLAACQEKPTIDTFITEVSAEVAHSDDVGGVALLARENFLVCQYTYKIDLPADFAATNLEEALADTTYYTGLLARLKERVPTAEALILEFLDKEGNLIYTTEFR